MRLYLSLTLKYLKENKKRTIVTVIGIILSAALISGVFTIAASCMDFEKRNTIEKNGMLHGTFNDINHDEIKYIENSSYVKESMVSKVIGYVLKDGELENDIKITALDSEGDSILPYKIEEGKMPKNSKEIALSKWALKELDKSIGDEIELNVYENQNDAVEHKEKVKNKIYRIVGKINCILGESKGSGRRYAVTGLKGENISGNYSVSLVLKDKKDIRKQFEEIGEKAGIKKIDGGESNFSIEFNESLLRLYGQSQYDNVNKSLVGIVIIVSLLVILATISTIYNSFSISILERKKAFATLASVGTTKGQLKKMVFLEATIMSLIAIPLGIICGIVALNLVFKVIREFLGASAFKNVLELNFVFNLKVVIFSFIVTFITILISAFIPAIKASKTSPIEGIKESNEYKIGKARGSFIVKKILGVEGNLAYKNLKRNKKKYRITIFSITFSVILFIACSGIVSMVEDGLNVFYRGKDVDFAITPVNEKYDYKLDEVLNKIEGLEAIEKAVNANYMMMDQEITKEDVDEKVLDSMNFDEKEKAIVKSMVVGISKGELNLLKDSIYEGNFDDDNKKDHNGVILVNNNVFKTEGKLEEIKMFKFKVGDYIELKAENNDEVVKVRVDGICNKSPMGIPNMGECPFFITSQDIFKNIEKEVKDKDMSISTMSFLGIKAKDVDEAKTSLEKIIASENELNFNDAREEMRSIKETQVVIKIFLYGFITVITLIGIANIINTIQTNIALRKREFAVMQSVGVTPNGLNKIIYLESFLYGFISLIIGIPIGVLVSYGIYNFIAETIGFGFELNIQSIVIALISVFLIVFLAAYFPVKKLRKDSIVDNIKMENV